jgi:Kdo2-lipid IVA lauroyltransferase/acyltransferase
MNLRSTLTRRELRLFRLTDRLFRFIGRIPRPAAKRIGNALGEAAFWLDKRHRDITLNNLRAAFEQKLDASQRQSLARAVYRNLGQILFEVGWSLSADWETLCRQITITGLENYQEAYRRGKGVLAITAHMGNWELLPIVAKRAQIPINIVYRPLDFKPLDRFFEHTRSRYGAKLIPSRRALVKILKALRKGEAVAMLMDQNVDFYEGVWVDFFGHPACTSKAMAVIAMKTEAAVLPVFLYRQADGFRAVFGQILTPAASTGDKQKDVEARTAQYTKVIEDGVRVEPDQWFWVHQRWKTRTFSPWPRQERSS